MPSCVPLDEARLLVEAVGERPRRAAVGRNDGQPRVAREVVVLPMEVEKTIWLPSGDQRGFVVRPGLRDDLLDGVVGERQHVDVGGLAVDQIGIDRRAERDPRAVGRPRGRRRR